MKKTSKTTKPKAEKPGRKKPSGRGKAAAVAGRPRKPRRKAKPPPEAEPPNLEFWQMRYETRGGYKMETTTCARVHATLDGICSGFQETPCVNVNGFSWKRWYALARDYPLMKADWMEARELGKQSRETLRDDARLQRGVYGWLEPVFWQGAEVGHVRRFSDPCLNHSKAQRVELTGPGGKELPPMVAGPPVFATMEAWAASMQKQIESDESARDLAELGGG